MAVRRQLAANKNKLFIFLDSGAFTAWRSGEVLTTEAYGEFIRANSHLVDVVASLDVLPGQYGRAPTREEVESSAKASYANHQKLKRMGLTPIPVFHRGESFRWLERYLEDGEPYIGVSPLATTAAVTAQEWLDEVFTLITDKQGRALVKTHGFAMTKVNLLLRYPFTTVDSTSWAMVASYGSVLIPKFIAGKPDFSKAAYAIAVSADNQKSPSAYDRMSPLEQDRIREYLDKYVGVTMPEVRNYYKGRQKANLYLLQQVEKLCHDVRFTNHMRNTQFSPKDYACLEGRQPLKQQLRILSAIIMGNAQTDLLYESGFHNLLMSYALLRKELPDTLENLQRTGTLRPPKKAIPLKADFEKSRFRQARALAIHQRSLQTDD